MTFAAVQRITVACLGLIGMSESPNDDSSTEITIGQAQTRILRLMGDGSADDIDFVLTMAWLCVKDAAALLVTLCTSQVDGDEFAIYSTTIALFVDLLTRIKGARVKGALDACAACFARLCHACRRHPSDERIRRLPSVVVIDQVAALHAK